MSMDDPWHGDPSGWGLVLDDTSEPVIWRIVQNKGVLTARIIVDNYSAV